MRFFFDARYIRTDFHDGISRYTTELANALDRQTKGKVAFLISDEAQKALLPEGADCIHIHPTTSLKEPLTALILNKYEPDVVATPLQTMGSFGRNFKLILNQQDVTYYKHAQPPAQFSPLIRFGWRLYHLTKIPGRLTLNAADMVATVSETSKQEIEAMRLTKRPLIVVPNAARDLSEYLDTAHPLQSDKPRNLIYMGAFTPYKNTETLIKAMAHLPDDYTLHLLSRISPERKKELRQLIPKGTTVTFHNGVSDKKYAQLLADNAIMVSASKSEGYGLPVAEALKLGTPAVISDMPVFREVAGSGALFADPADPEDFASKIRLLEKASARKALVREGERHIDSFSWDASAKALLKAAASLQKR